VPRLAFVLVVAACASAFAGKPKKSPPPPPARASAAEVERLGRGFRAFTAGDYATARKELGKLDVAHFAARDYVLWLLAQSELLDGAADSARVRFQKLTLLGGRFQTLARWRVADAYFAAGKWDAARKAYEAALAQPSELTEPAVARFRIAQALEQRKATAAAASAYRKVYVNEPLHPLAERAFQRMHALDAAQAIAPADRVTRAKVLTANRAWPRALEELALVPADVPPALRDEADYWIGMTHFKMRHGYDIAAKKLLDVWSRLPGDDRKADALFHGARAQSRDESDDGGDDRAIDGYKLVVKTFPRARVANEAAFLVGWLEFNRGRYKDAIAPLEDMLRTRGGSQFADEARWYLGFSRWLAGDVAGALADFEKLAARPGALNGGKGAYWRGRALHELKRDDEAKLVWRELVATYPFSFYATLARVRLADAKAPVGPFGDGVAAAKRELRAPALDDEVVTHPPELDVLARVDELLGAGMDVEAGVELRRGEPELVRRLGSARALPLLFDRYARGADFHRPHQLAEAYAGGALSLDPQADAAVRRYWEEMYPRAYRAFVEKYGPSGDNPPYYLYTIMQKESAYDPHDVSYADAIGLLQMIPPTSRRVAERIDFAYTDDVLYDPEGNIRFGAWYIGHLLAKFRKQIALGAGAYNAGPSAMRKWLKRAGARPLDEFVELCSYKQTREYMKKVLDIYARYNYLYDKVDWLPSLKLDATAVEDGIEY
jgi:peptidoglycan lytic transglycosylase